LAQGSSLHLLSYFFSVLTRFVRHNRISMRKVAAAVLISLQLLQHGEAQPKGPPKARPKAAKAKGRRLQEETCTGFALGVVMPHDADNWVVALGGGAGTAGTWNDCVKKCIMDPGCKSFARSDTANNDDGAAICYFKSTWDEGGTTTGNGYDSYTVSGCQAKVCSTTYPDLSPGPAGEYLQFSQSITADQYTCNSICLATGCASITWPTPSPAASPAECWLSNTIPSAFVSATDYTGIEVDWTSCASTDCTVPSVVTTGYVIGAVAGGTMTFGSFVPPTSGLSCNAALGYTGVASATTCSAGEAYTLTGCTATLCIAPNPVTTGYSIGTLGGGTLTAGTFTSPTSGITCNAAAGFTETVSSTAPVAVDCGAGNGGTAYTLSGCTATTPPTTPPTPPPPPDWYTTGGATTASVIAGDTVLQVSQSVQLQFNIGDPIIIGYGTANAEENTVAGFGSIVLATGTVNAHASGIQVVVNSAAIAAGDPVTHYRGKKIKFWLPNYQMMPMLRTQSIQVHASTFPGETCDLQWFDRFVLSSLSGQALVTVNVQRGIANRTEARMGVFQQLEITMPGSSEPLRALERPRYGNKDKKEMYQDYGGNQGSVRIRIGQTASQNSVRKTFSQQFEYVYVETPELAFTICPAHANVEFPSDRVKALRYAHLDLLILEMRGETTFTGILPQLWGVLPLSEEVEAMTAPPDAETCAASAAWGSPQELSLPRPALLQSF